MREKVPPVNADQLANVPQTDREIAPVDVVEANS